MKLIFICWWYIWFSSVQLLSRVQLFVTSWTAAHQASLYITNSQRLPKLMSIESGNAIQPSHPLLSLSLLALNLSQHQCLFEWVSSSHQVAKVLEFQFQHQSFQWTPGLISFRMHWLDLLTVQGNSSSPIPQFKSINSSVLSLLHSPTLTSIHDHWKNHSLD